MREKADLKNTRSSLVVMAFMLAVLIAIPCQSGENTASDDSFPAKAVSLFVNGMPIKFEDGRVLEDGAILVPLTEFSAFLNAKATVSPENDVTVVMPDKSTVKLSVGQDGVAFADGSKSVAGASLKEKDKVYVPAAAILTLIGSEVVPGPGPDSLTIIFNDLLMRKQRALRDGVFNTYAAKEYTPDAPFVVLDPFELSPLAALVMFKTTNDAAITVEIVGKDTYSSLKHDFFEFKKDHAVPIYGLYPDTENEIRLTVIGKDGTAATKTISIKTGPLPKDISKVEVAVEIPEKMAKGFNFFDCPHKNGNYHTAIDSNGDIRWYISDKSLNGGFMMAHMRNGNKIISTGNVVPHSYNNIAGAYEVTPLGWIVARYDVFGVHHDIREKQNGDLIFGATITFRPTQNDFIAEIDRKTGKELRSWDLMEIIPLDEYDTKPPYTGGLGNWLHNNAIWLVEDEHAFVLSGRHQNLLMKFDYESGEVLWWFSDRMNNSKPGFDKTRLKPTDPDFEYPMSQHAIMQLPDGKIMLFDNRNDNVQLPDGSLDQSKLYSRGVIYQVDPAAGTVREVWQYGKERGVELYSSYISDVDYLGENHYLITFGGIYRTKDGVGLDHIMSSAKAKAEAERVTVVVELLNDEIVFEAKMHGTPNSNSYKSERFPIYQNATEAVFLGK